MSETCGTPVDSSSKTDTTASGAGTSTTSQQSAAGQTAAGAASQTTGTQAGAAGALAQEETVADVGQGEAYIINMKRMVENALNLDQQLNQILVANAQRLARNAEDFDGQLRQLAMTSLSNSVALANRVNNSSVDADQRVRDNAETHDKQMDANSVSERERTVRQGDVAITTTWADLAKNPVFQDLVASAAIAAVDRAMAKKAATV